MRQYTNDPRWFISGMIGQPRGWRRPLSARKLAAMPGTLHQDYATPAEAIAAAQWWGYRVRRVKPWLPA